MSRARRSRRSHERPVACASCSKSRPRRTATPTTARRTVATAPRNPRRAPNRGGAAARALPRRVRPAALRSPAPRVVAARAVVPGGETTRNGNDADGNVAFNRPISGGEHVPPKPKRAIAMEWVETTGRTIAEALDAALDELG